MNLNLTPKVLRWARERAGLDQATLARKVTGKPTTERVKQWEKTGMLTFAQVKKLAHATHTPEGFLYLNEPPDDRLPIPDFRTVGDERVRLNASGIESGDRDRSILMKHNSSTKR